jgi:hypothetical protein
MPVDDDFHRWWRADIVGYVDRLDPASRVGVEP